MAGLGEQFMGAALGEMNCPCSDNGRVSDYPRISGDEGQADDSAQQDDCCDGRMRAAGEGQVAPVLDALAR